MSLDIDKRNGGCGVVFDGKFYLWGGQTVDKLSVQEEDEEDSDVEEVEVPVDLPRNGTPGHPFDVLDTATCRWSRQPTGGTPPLLGLGSSLLVHRKSRSFFLFGGWNQGHFDNSVYRISTESWEWEVAPSSGAAPSPRYCSGAVIYGSAVCVFAGVGPDIGSSIDKEAEYHQYMNIGTGFGWNNEYLEFNFETGHWSAPLTKGANRPQPMGGHSMTKIDPHRALVFGGNSKRGRLNTAYILDLEMKEFQGPLSACGPEQPWPRERRFASLTPLTDPEVEVCECGPALESRVLLMWGKYASDNICNEAWVLDVTTFTWNRVETGLMPRSWHVAQALYDCHASSSECRVFVFGGNAHSNGLTGARLDTADLRVLSFGLQSLVDMCLSVIVNSEELLTRLSELPPRTVTQITEAINVNHFLCRPTIQ